MIEYILFIHRSLKNMCRIIKYYGRVRRCPWNFKNRFLKKTNFRICLAYPQGAHGFPQKNVIHYVKKYIHYMNHDLIFIIQYRFFYYLLFNI